MSCNQHEKHQDTGGVIQRTASDIVLELACSAMRVLGGSAGGYSSIPENEAVEVAAQESSVKIPTLPAHHCSRMNGDRWDDSGLEDVQPPPAANRKRNMVLFSVGTFAFIIICMGIRGVVVQTNMERSSRPKYNKHSRTSVTSLYPPESRLFDGEGRYVMADFDTKPAFSDFLPAVAGLYGKPIWAFFVNRGQAIATFGSTSKDYPILEFNSANKAYQNTAFLGFRTFLQGSRRDKKFLAEPFAPANARFGAPGENLDHLPRRYMYVGRNDLAIQEIDTNTMVETNVSYFILPEETFGSFVRRTTVTNIDPDNPLKLSMLDGLARMEPSGGKLNDYLKNMGRTLEGWFGVYHADDQNITMPFYRMSSRPADSAAVVIEEAGHYCLAFVENREAQPLPIVYDTRLVFGEDSNLLRPVGLMGKTVQEIVGTQQYGWAKTSSAFAALEEVTLDPGQSITVSSVYGKAEFITDVPVVARKLMQSGYVQYKLSRAREIVNQLTASVEMKTGNSLFDGHVEQMFLDNGLRGGFPMILGDVDDRTSLSNADEDGRLKVFHVFSRVQGDLERDYNDFIIDSSYYSEGPGNFRDVVQNRRNDVLFSPRIGSVDIKVFLSYIQADGYEPLRVEAVVFTISSKSVCDSLATMAVGSAVGHRAQRDALSQILCNGPFRPGQLFLLMEEQHIDLIVDRQKFINEVAAASDFTPMAVFGDGYWADHWTYYLDLIESYCAIYPEGEEALMYDRSLGYFFSPVTVLPRSEKYVLSYTFNGKKRHVRQLNATTFDKKKEAVQMNYVQATTGWYGVNANWQNDKNGTSFESSPLAKLFLLGSLKFATRDAYGMGIEYEAGKPGWNDAMNGLVGMVGSGMPETYELKLLLKYVLSVLVKYKRDVTVPIELGILVDTIMSALDDLDETGYVDEENLSRDVPEELFSYWDSVASARELYRSNVSLYFSGDTRVFASMELIPIIERWLQEIDLGIARAQKIGSHGAGNDGSSKVTPTYFSYNVTDWTLTGGKNGKGQPLVNATAMSVGVFALFLEGPVRMMKTVDEEQALEIYEQVKASGLRDEQLKMYTVSASLSGQSRDMGRMMAFSPGWLENQSVWTHMSYKFYLELLRKNHYAQFYDEMRSGGMLPFMDADVYGRSLMECSSFIASSAFADPSQRGRGFLARLSGATAEFLNMWLLMFIGPKPFYLHKDTGELMMSFTPALPKWLFKSDETASNELTIKFKLFGTISVTYHNTDGKDLFRVRPRRYLITRKDGSTVSVTGSALSGDDARSVRSQMLVDAIDIYF